MHLPTGLSNQQYYQPEKVLDPSGCEHRFVVTNIGAREVECDGCHWTTGFHAGVNFTEVDGSPTIVIKGRSYPVSL